MMKRLKSILIFILWMFLLFGVFHIRRLQEDDATREKDETRTTDVSHTVKAAAKKNIINILIQIIIKK